MIQKMCGSLAKSGMCIHGHSYSNVANMAGLKTQISALNPRAYFVLH